MQAPTSLALADHRPDRTNAAAAVRIGAALCIITQGASKSVSSQGVSVYHGASVYQGDRCIVTSTSYDAPVILNKGVSKSGRTKYCLARSRREYGVGVILSMA